jgi:nucleotide-binding universal stress UspA family protein
VYEHIIVPFDGTDRAQHSAVVGRELATLFDAPLVLATAGEEPESGALKDAKARAMGSSDDRVTVWLEPGSNETKAMVTMAKFRPNALFCMYTNARTGLLRLVYGSLADRLLHKTDTPVLLIGPRATESTVANLQRLIVAVDDDPSSLAAVALACTWADAMPVNAVVVHVNRGDGPATIDLGRLAYPLESRCGTVEKVIVDNARVVPGLLQVVGNGYDSVVVMATAGRVGIRRVAAGSVMAEMSQRSPVPVLATRA